MAKDKLVDYDSTASGNLDVGGISVAEGMLPSNVNNAIREQMSHLKDFADGTEAINALAVDNLKMDGNTISSTNTNGDITLDPNGTGNVDVTGTIKADGLTVDTSDQVLINHSADGGGIRIDSTNNTNTGSVRFGDVADNYIGAVEYNHSTDAMSFYVNNVTRTTISSSGILTTQCTAGSGNYAFGAYNPTSTSSRVIALFQSNVGGTQENKVVIQCDGKVGIGTASPSRLLSLNSSNASIDFSNGTWKNEIINSSGQMEFRADHTNAAAASLMSFSVDGSEAARLDASGNLLIGKTTLDYEGTAGSILRGDGFINLARSNGNVTDFNRLDSDGDVVRISQDGTTIGNITVSGSALVFGAGNTGLKYGSDIVSPSRADNGNDRDNVIDLGKSASRFDDIFATNGTIQTSDANEKQQIAALTDAEMTAAKAISQLFKTFKWNSAVEAKGDAARTHAGVIAQDVEAAMTAAGLDAGDYAFFISDTWWETPTEVPAVEAVEAVDAVYEDVVIPAVEEELDEDGNVIVEAQPERIESRLVSEAIVPVEAKEAYTRTDTYDTAEEAPEGATERTRMGIRYPELLAFVGAATEQRLANIETRLAALEA